ncbi:hypothetical protein ABZ916_39355 [Streptomyces sp. NPDC046853]|uniref:hypothetical protein n=1 Tax=Streptomyces sp. NPDC046853 TaxID=3154920 RepID=UPI0033DF92B7
MTWPPEQTEAPPAVSWTLQVRYRPDGWWSDHTGGLVERSAADALLAERQSANPQLRYRLVRDTTTRVVEPATS